MNLNTAPAEVRPGPTATVRATWTARRRRRRRPAGPEAAFPGSILYAQGREHLDPDRRRGPASSTSAGTDSMPSWSPDGQTVYFIRTTEEIGVWPSQGPDRRYLMTVPQPDERPRGRLDQAGAAPDRQVQEGRSDLVLLDAPAGHVTQRQDLRARVRCAGSHEVRRHPAVLDARHGQVEHPATSPRSRPWVIRIRPGGRTGRCCSTSATAARAPRALRSSTAGTWPRRRRRL